MAAGDWRCVACGEAGLSDWLGNVLLFVPLGALLVRAGARARGAAVAGTLFSVAVELAQSAGIPGRTPSGGDVLANGVGAAAGAALGVWWWALAAPTPGAARRLAAAAAVCWVAVCAAAGWLFGREPAGGPPTPRTGVLAHTPGFGYFHGRVAAGAVGGRALPPAAAAGPMVVGAATGRDVAATVTTVGGDGRPSFVPILGVYDDRGAAQLLLGQRGGDAVLRVRLRAARWRLRAPELVVADVLAGLAEGAPAQTARLDGALRGDTLRLAVRVTGRAAAVAAARLTPGSAWQLLPVPRTWGPGDRAISAAWLVAVLGPVGYWLAHAAATRSGRRRAGAAGLAVVAAGLWGVPALGGRAAAPWWEWAAALAGLCVGALAARRVRRPAAPSPERRVAAAVGPRQLSPP